MNLAEDAHRCRGAVAIRRIAETTDASVVESDAPGKHAG
jgi:hypothetical protein